MSIIVKGAGTLKQHLSSGAAVEDVATVGQAIEQLALPPVGSMLMLVNGQMAHWQTPLEDGDTLELIPAICGGS
ncbi:MAG: MoaD/ThiS family protein [Caldilineaceae bacterium]|nr:MoaD/ThiS family protein [Caldilineaceae bacterium]